jgi:hypothetical protein
MRSQLIELLNNLSVPLLAVAVSYLAYSVNKGQLRIAKEKLRYDLYDRRFAVYMAFHRLLLAVAENDKAANELREANAAHAQSPFLLDASTGAYLEKLHEEAFRVDKTKELVCDQTFATVHERGVMASQLANDKLNLFNRITELSHRFEPFLKLKDFAKHDG